jgi:hypothetical protein
MMSQRYVTKNPDQDIVDHAQYCKELHQVINKGYS